MRIGEVVAEPVRQRPYRFGIVSVGSAIGSAVAVGGGAHSTGGTDTPIVPVVLGDTLRTYVWARRLLDDGIYVSAVPSGAVPEGQSRLRLCATAARRAEDLDRPEAALDRVAAG